MNVYRPKNWDQRVWSPNELTQDQHDCRREQGISAALANEVPGKEVA